MLSWYRSRGIAESWLPGSRKYWEASNGLTVARRRGGDADTRLLSKRLKVCRFIWQYGLKQLAVIVCICQALHINISIEAEIQMRIIYDSAALEKVCCRVPHASPHVARNGPIRQTCAKAIVSPCVKSSDWLLSASHWMLRWYRSRGCGPLEWSH
jgi:hypothetical protein